MACSFGDRRLEEEYQKSCAETVIDRFKPAAKFFMIPMHITTTLALILFRLYFPYTWTFAEFLFSLCRIIAGSALSFIFLAEWNEMMKIKLSGLVIWVTRLSFFLIAIQEFGLKQHDSDFHFLLIWVQYFSGIVTSTFGEYCVAATILSYIKPARHYFLGESCRSNPLKDCSVYNSWHMLQQHSILLLMGLSITYLMHSDRRRLWLSSRGRFKARNKSSQPGSRRLPGEGRAGMCDMQSLRLQIVRVVGTGSFGYVYKAVDRTTKQSLAVKVIPTNFYDRSGFDDAMKTLAKVDHPHLVKLLPPIIQGNAVWIAMEYCSGGSMSDLLTDVGPLPEIAVRFFTEQIVSALCCLRSYDIIHKDLKCGNILLASRNVVKLADYGALCRLKLETRLAQEGKQTHLAPEVLRGEREGWEGDVWSLGCCVLEMLACRTVLGTVAVDQNVVSWTLMMAQVREKSF
jgi:serine/threonine-protein kinase 24/25/MST4